MQHNALHGSENKNFSKNQDHPHNVSTPPAPTHPNAQANSAIAATDTQINDPPTEDFTDSPTTPSDFNIHEIIDTNIFEVPSLPQANMASTSSSNLHEDFALDDLIFDAAQYISYDN